MCQGMSRQLRFTASSSGFLRLLLLMTLISAYEVLVVVIPYPYLLLRACLLRNYGALLPFYWIVQSRGHSKDSRVGEVPAPAQCDISKGGRFWHELQRFQTTRVGLRDANR